MISVHEVSDNKKIGHFITKLQKCKGENFFFFKKSLKFLANKSNNLTIVTWSPHFQSGPLTTLVPIFNWAKMSLPETFDWLCWATAAAPSPFSSMTSSSSSAGKVPTRLHHHYIPYSRKYWRELNLAVGSQIAISNVLADLNLVVWYRITICI